MAGEPPEHHRVDGTDACTGQHRESGLGNHGHVDQHAIALLHALLEQHRRHALHFDVQLPEAVGALGVRFGGHVDQRVLVCAVFQVPVHRVVAQVGQPALEPVRERRVVVVAHPVEGLVPVHQPGLFGPEGITVVDGEIAKIIESHQDVLG